MATGSPPQPSTESAGATVVDFWFDASCPFTWWAARWLAEAAPASTVAVHPRWRLMSLVVLNEGTDVSPGYRATLRRTRGPMRLLAAAGRHSGSDVIGPLYFAIGRRRHDEGRTIDRDLLVEALAEVGLPTELVDAAEDPSWDEVVRASHEEGQASVGEPAGSPVVGVGDAPAFFGPVLSAVPSPADGVRLLEAFITAAQVPELCELKRSRRDRA